MAPNLGANVPLGSQEHPVTWRAAAKDGAMLPSRLAKSQNAILHIVSGEAYDFEFQPNTSGEIPWKIENTLTNGMSAGKIVVRRRVGEVYRTHDARATARLCRAPSTNRKTLCVPRSRTSGTSFTG